MNTMSSETRKYELKERGKRQRATRQRIVEATADLHREVGPARTTVAEIARRAGVQRLTVYTHFPDEVHLIQACQARFYAVHPPPDFSVALKLEMPSDRVAIVLERLYEWYRETEDGIAPVLQDRGTVPALDQVVTEVVDAPHAELAIHLAAAFGLQGQAGDRLRALIRLALDFWTWRRLKNEGLSDSAAADVMTGAITAIASQSNPAHE